MSKFGSAIEITNEKTSKFGNAQALDGSDLITEINQKENPTSGFGGILGGIGDSILSSQVRKTPLEITGKEDQPFGLFTKQDLSLEGTIEKRLGVDDPQPFSPKDVSTTLLSAFANVEGLKQPNKSDPNPLVDLTLKVIRDNNLSTGKKLTQLKKIFPGSKIFVKKGDAFIKMANGVEMKIFKDTKSFAKNQRREYSLPIFNPDNFPFLSKENFETSVGLQFSNDPKAERDVIKENIPGAKFAKDKFGNYIVDYVDGEGKRRIEYINPRGTTGQDVAKFGGQGGLFALFGGASGFAKSILKKMGIGTVAAATTSVTIDKIAEQFGSKQGVSPFRALFAGIFGGISEGIAPFFAKFFKSKRFIDDNGKITAAGRREAKKAKIDPDEFQQSIDEIFAGMADDLVRDGKSQTKQFGIPLTQGQATQSPKNLADEELILKGAFGPKSQKILKDFQKVQDDAIDEATDSARRALSNNKRAALDTELEAGSIIAEGIKDKANALSKKIDDAFEFAGQQEAVFSRKAFADFEKIIKNEFNQGFQVKNDILVGGSKFPLSSETPGTLTALKELSRLNKVLSGEGGKTASEPLKGIDLQAIVRYRRFLNTTLNSAKNNADTAGLMQIKRGLDDWLEKTIDNALLSGSPKALEAIKKANALRAEFGRLFEPRIKKSRAVDSVGKKLEQLVKDDITDGQLLNWIFGANQIGGTQLSVQFIKRIKDIVQPGTAEWNALRQAAFLRLEKDIMKNGKLLKGKFASNIDKAINGRGREVMKELFTDAEINLLKQLGREIQLTNPAPLNPSGTAPGFAVMLSSFLERFGAAKVLGGAATGNIKTATTGGGFIAVSAIARFFSGARAKAAVKGVVKNKELPAEIKAILPAIGTTNQ